MLRRSGIVGLLLALACWLPSGANAGPALVFEPYKGTVFYAEDPDLPWHPASLTKLMTAYVTFQAVRAGQIRLDSKIACSQRAHSQAPTKLGLPVGSEISLELAVKAIIVRSANDVSVMIAEAVAGSEDAFIDRMNAQAKRLGMTRTRFFNPHGLPDDRQISSARDMAKLTRALILEFPEYADWFSLPQVQVGKQTLRTHNGLLMSFEGADGMKTGFICDSGYNVVASATRDGRRLVAVVLGEPSVASRRDRATELLEHGFRRYFWKSLFGNSIDGLAVEVSANERPRSLRSQICGGGRASANPDGNAAQASAAPAR
jgi:D-alanyl-D-alanine carboxypeptidase